MITNNENKELLFYKKLTNKKNKYEELAEKIQPSLDLFLCNYDNSKDNEIKGDF